MHIAGFIMALITMPLIAVGFTWPRFYQALIPRAKRGQGHIPFKPDVSVAVIDVSVGRILEEGDLERRNASISAASGRAVGGGYGGDKDMGMTQRAPSDSDDAAGTGEKPRGVQGRGPEVY